VTALKTVSYTVRGTLEQSIRWRRAAEGDGHRSVGAWLANAADAYLRARLRGGGPVPLAWHYGYVRVVLADGSAVQVRAMVSPPFATFQGTGEGPDGNKYRTLVYIPTGQVIATLRSAGQAKQLAAELAPVWLRDRDLAAGIVNRHEREQV